MINSRKRKQT